MKSINSLDYLQYAEQVLGVIVWLVLEPPDTMVIYMYNQVTAAISCTPVLLTYKSLG